jgi:hypothetical protein
MTPSLQIGSGNWAVKSDSLLGYKTIDGKYYPREMAFTRATTGTRVNAEGLVEVVPYNLLQYSEQFDNAYWGKNDGAINVNNTTAPDGKATADKFTASANNAFHYVNLFTALTISETHTFSFYVKKSTSTWIFFTFRDNAINYFNLDTGAFGTTPDSCTSQSVGNGWYRITVTKNTTPANCGIGVAGGNGGAQFNAAGTEAVFIWGAQLVEGSNALDYLPTTTRLNIPRIDYSTGSPALLVEPQRTNVVTWSEQLDNSNWVKGDATISANSAIAPNGTNTADKFIANSNNIAHFFYQPVPTGSYSFSIYAKAAEETVFSMWLNDFSKNAVFDLSTGTVVLSNVSSANITDVGNGWYRCEAYDTTSTSFVGVFGRNATAYIGNGVNGMFFWGAQVEAASYTTSYIPTTSASVTRNADQVLKTGISSLIGTEFTLFFDGFESIGGDYSRYLVLKGSGGTYANFISIESNPTNLVAVNVNNASSTNIFYAVGAVTSGQRFKLAVRLKNNDFALYLNGALIATSTSATVPTTSDLYLGYYTDYADNYNEINAAAILKTALTNTQLAELTTL